MVLTLPRTELTVDVDLYNSFPCALSVIEVDEDDLTKELLTSFLLEGDTIYAVGLAPTYTADLILNSLAISTAEKCIVIRFRHHTEKRRTVIGEGRQGRHIMALEILANAELVKVALKMDSLASALFLDLNVAITRATDLLSTSSEEKRFSLQSYLNALDSNEGLNAEKVVELFQDEESSATSVSQQSTQAWASLHAFGRFVQDGFDLTLKIDAHIFSPDVRIPIISPKIISTNIAHSTSPYSRLLSAIWIEQLLWHLQSWKTRLTMLQSLMKMVSLFLNRRDTRTGSDARRTK
jgi:hypothetical protein